MGQRVLYQFTEILRDLLDDNDIILEPETRREEIPAWDSLNYVNFIIAVEMKYGVKFAVSQIETFENVGEIAEEVEKRLGA